MLSRVIKPMPTATSSPMLRCFLEYVIKNILKFVPEDGEIRSSETSVTIYPTTQPNVPEDLDLQQQRRENLKSRKSCAVLKLFELGPVFCFDSELTLK